MTPAGGADHVVPLVSGGPNDPGNLAPACEDCNRSKGARTPDEWRNPVRKSCEGCGEPFTKWVRKERRFCSVSCSRSRPLTEAQRAGWTLARESRWRSPSELTGAKAIDLAGPVGPLTFGLV